VFWIFLLNSNTDVISSVRVMDVLPGRDHDAMINDHDHDHECVKAWLDVSDFVGSCVAM